MSIVAANRTLSDFTFKPITEDDYTWLNDRYNESVSMNYRLTDELDRVRHDLTVSQANARDAEATIDTLVAEARGMETKLSDLTQMLTREIPEILLNVERAHLRGETLPADWYVRRLTELEAEILAVL